MELDEWIRKQIDVFMEGHKAVEERDQPMREEERNPVPDYEVQIRRALDNNRYEEATAIFKELREKFNAVPLDHQQERKQYYHLIQKSYKDIYDYVAERHKTVRILQQMSYSADVFNQSVPTVDPSQITPNQGPIPTVEQAMFRKQREDEKEGLKLPDMPQFDPVTGVKLAPGQQPSTPPAIQPWYAQTKTPAQAGQAEQGATPQPAQNRQPSAPQPAQQAPQPSPVQQAIRPGQPQQPSVPQPAPQATTIQPSQSAPHPPPSWEPPSMEMSAKASREPTKDQKTAQSQSSEESPERTSAESAESRAARKPINVPKMKLTQPKHRKPLPKVQKVTPKAVGEGPKWTPPTLEGKPPETDKETTTEKAVEDDRTPAQVMGRTKRKVIRQKRTRPRRKQIKIPVIEHERSEHSPDWVPPAMGLQTKAKKTPRGKVRLKEVRLMAADDLLTQAEQAIERGDLKQAQSLLSAARFERIRAGEAEHSPIHRLEARLAHHLTPHMPLPDDAEFFSSAYLQGIQAMGRGDYDKAITYFQKRVMQTPHDKAARIRLMECLEVRHVESAG